MEISFYAQLMVSVWEAIVAVASPVFSHMFSSPRPDASNSRAGNDQTRDGLVIVQCTDNARSLDLMLRRCYPVASPQLVDLDDVLSLLEAARKYEIDVFDEAIDMALAAMQPSNEIRLEFLPSPSATISTGWWQKQPSPRCGSL
ncbi:hypothetical protein BV25DRAFT_1824875 [Artomyces pyxidatus]|uniref:Uncharacterized protein n=1 Tax=Artomyces pyxidatus TaxID=48021 RepID=A0ACB8T2V4_9AGAM|nr:hypothetical protein BV25DRAFT_1824875 [Artomyces pyxidatus]